jgi:uncharacterized Zn finger protein
MSRRDHRDDYPPGRPAGPRPPPPEHGIKVKRIGSTWWGQRWIRALEAISEGYSGRLARGRVYARTGRVHDLVVAAGKVTASVTGSRPEPYQVTIELDTLSDSAWSQAIQAMAGQARFAADLLAGQMPAELDEAFQAAGTSLFPVEEADLETTCSCPDWANPCKHVAATHYVLGEALDRDPFLLLELRGRTRDRALTELRAARAEDQACGASPEDQARGASPEDQARGASPEGGDEEPAAARPRRRRGGGGPRDLDQGAEVEIARVKLGKLSAAEYDRPRAALPALHLALDAPAAPGALLQQLGKPGSWSIDASPVDLLAPLVRAAAERARELALAEPAPGAPGAVAAEAVSDHGDVPEPSAASAARPARRKRTSTPA